MRVSHFEVDEGSTKINWNFENDPGIVLLLLLKPPEIDVFIIRALVWLLNSFPPISWVKEVVKLEYKLLAIFIFFYSWKHFSVIPSKLDELNLLIIVKIFEAM